MISSGQLIGFTLASFVLIVVPGPGVLFVVGRALSHGRRTAFATAAGHAAGNYVVAACVAVGLGTILQRSAQVFIAVKLIGALYLMIRGVQAIRHRKSLATAMSATAGASDGWRAAGRAGGRRHQPEDLHLVRRGRRSGDDRRRPVPRTHPSGMRLRRVDFQQETGTNDQPDTRFPADRLRGRHGGGPRAARGWPAGRPPPPGPRW
jgi:hypothetical protein